MRKYEYHYTIYPDNSMEKFKEACKKIEQGYPNAKKREIIIDVDGSLIQEYLEQGKKIILFDDYDVGAVYADSDIDISSVIEDYWKNRKRHNQAKE